MPRRGLPLESYAAAVVHLILAGLMVYGALVWDSWIHGFLAALPLLYGTRNRDYRTEGRWWISAAVYAGVLAYLVAESLGFDAPGTPSADVWFIWNAFIGCLVAQLILLLAGRLRRAWTFARPPE